MVSVGFRWFQQVLDGFSRFEMVSVGFRWSQQVLDGFSRYQMEMDGFMDIDVLSGLQMEIEGFRWKFMVFTWVLDGN